MEISIKVFLLSNGKAPFLEWIRRLRDERAEQIIDARLARLRMGNPGDCSSVGEGISELKIHFGPGYRVYFGSLGETLVVLLIAGVKGTQDGDIKKAKEYWREYKTGKKDVDY